MERRRCVLREGSVKVNTPAGWRPHYAVVLFDGTGGLAIEFYGEPGGRFEGQISCTDEKLRQVVLLDSTPAMQIDITSERVVVISTPKEEDYQSWLSSLLLGLKEAASMGNNISQYVSPPIHKTGYLLKTGPSGKVWKKRWFVLVDHILRYYKRPTSSEELGLIDLDCSLGINNIEQTPKSSGFPFTIETTSRIFNFLAETEEDRRDWLRTLVLTGLPIVSRSSRSTFYVNLDLSAPASDSFTKKMDTPTLENLLDEYLPVVDWLGGKFADLHKTMRPKSRDEGN
jgi:hypothetical protein